MAADLFDVIVVGLGGGGQRHGRGARLSWGARAGVGASAVDEDVLRAGLRRSLPAADGPTLASRTCLFTNTPDEHFSLDRHPRLPQVVLASACSWHGFKFASVIGPILADLVLDGGTAHDIAMFRLGPFLSATGPDAWRRTRVAAA